MWETKWVFFGFFFTSNCVEKFIGLVMFLLDKEQIKSKHMTSIVKPVHFLFVYDF